ncbi:aldo/keto reductase [Streptomyces sp. 8L]|uniref:aldo/keto reductase n=1 Tax=Streptomyces sp. 8L TaxID=2877242 RepID=UPI001CD54383|nr:aldo/keto reductase [Streptomyces sp. 8L]MCA1217121.1 aldo/keto reductase [Streptomyces sp. 8L]
MLGRSGLKVSPLTLGTMNFGALDGVTVCSPDEADRIVGAFLDAGHNVIDTADKYNDGQAEEILGRVLKARRDSVVLATKAGQPQGLAPNDRGLSRAHLTRALEESLRRLGTDHIDLYQCHLPDPDTPPEETMATLDMFVRAGKVRYIGCSNYSASQLVEAQWAAERVGGAPFVSQQLQYSLVSRQAEAETLPVGARHGMGALTWSPLGAGVLAGRYQRGAGAAGAPKDSRLGRVTARSERLGRYWATTLLADRKFDIAQEVSEVAIGLGASPAAVAIAWLLQREHVTSVVIGPRTSGHLTDILGVDGLTLPAEALARLDEISTPT